MDPVSWVKMSGDWIELDLMRLQGHALFGNHGEIRRGFQKRLNAEERTGVLLIISLINAHCLFGVNWGMVLPQKRAYLG